MLLQLVKLGTLALKTASKPISTHLKNEATLHPKFRQLMLNFAQADHRLTTQIQRLYGHPTDVKIPPLNEEKAIQAASNLIGELFVFTVAGAAVVYGVQTSANSETKKEEARRQQWETLKQKVEELAQEVETLAQVVEEVLQEFKTFKQKMEELGKQEFETLKPKMEEAVRQIETLKQKIQEIAQEIETVRQMMEGLEKLGKVQ